MCVCLGRISFQRRSLRCIRSRGSVFCCTRVFMLEDVSNFLEYDLVFGVAPHDYQSTFHVGRVEKRWRGSWPKALELLMFVQLMS